MARSEPLRIPLSVEATLLANAAALQSLWTAWQPNLLRTVPVYADPAPSPEHLTRRRSLSFFTGGIDSRFTALCSSHSTEADHELIHIDFPSSHSDSSAEVVGVRNAAEAANLGEGLAPWGACRAWNPSNVPSSAKPADASGLAPPRCNLRDADETCGAPRAVDLQRHGCRPRSWRCCYGRASLG